ncbi:MAG: FtsX-like permease family protein [Bacteroidota bacterium]|jgi:ABC-type lipoprotein release transport system permease subunit
MVLLFAWKNLWRNKRRTLLAASSIFFAVLLAACMRAMQLGTYEYMVTNSVSLYTGYLQVQGNGYWEDRSFDESFEPSRPLMESLRRNPHITTINPRLETVALISHGTETRIAPVSGISPAEENAMTGLAGRIVKGKYLSDSSKGIMVSEGLADRLNIRIGDSLIVFGQGYQGVTAAAQLEVEGILHFPIPQLNNAMAFLSLPNAQNIFNTYGRVTSVVLMIDDATMMKQIQAGLSAAIDSSLVIKNWEEMTPELVQSIEADNASGILMLGILYVVIGFGVFGTVMMMVIERTREFGLLIALGMRRSRLLTVTTLEAVLVSMIGAVAGMAGSFPIILYFHRNPIHVTGELAKAYLAWGIEPIIPISIHPSIFISQTVVVFLIALATSLYPLFFIRKIHPVSAIQGRGGTQ